MLHIRIHHECVAGIEKSVQMVAVCYPEVCQVRSNRDREGGIFHPILTQIIDSFSCLALDLALLFKKKDSQKFLIMLR